VRSDSSSAKPGHERLQKFRGYPSFKSRGVR
jgi:hypothetical protein